MNNKQYILLFGLPILLLVLGVLTSFISLAVFQPVPGLTRRDVVEINTAVARAAWHDILPSSSAKEIRDAPGKVLYAYRCLRIAGRSFEKPNQGGCVVCDIGVPGTDDSTEVSYLASKKEGRWTITRLPACATGSNWRDWNILMAKILRQRRDIPLSRAQCPMLNETASLSSIH